MKKKYSSTIGFLQLFGVLLTPTLTQAQVFQQIYTGSYNQSARDVIVTIDGGYVLAGMTENLTLGDSNVFIMKTNNLGDVTWTKEYGGANPDYPNSIIQDADGSYMVAGYTKSFGAGAHDSWVLRLNSSGDTLWTKTYGGPGDDEAKEIIPSGDGNYIVVGRTNNPPATLGFDAYMMKINASGDILWMQTYGGAQFDGANSVEQCTDGGYIFAGQTMSAGAGAGDHWIVRTTSTGDSLWAKTFGSSAFDEAKYIVANTDGTFVLCGNNYSSGDADIQAIKTDASGNMVWDKSYGGNDKDVGKTIEHTSDGGYIISSISRSFGWINPDMWLLKINGGGDTVWTKNYGSWDHEHAYAARQTADNGYIAVGHSKSYGPLMRIMFIKVDQNGGYVSVEQLLADDQIDVYPNPTSGALKIDLAADLADCTLRICNTLGQVIYSETADGKLNNTRTIDLSGQMPGIYYMSIQSQGKIATKKLILR